MKLTGFLCWLRDGGLWCGKPWRMLKDAQRALDNDDFDEAQRLLAELEELYG